MTMAARYRPWHPPRVRSFRHAVLLALAATAAGCATRSAEDAAKSGSPEAGRVSDSSPPEERWIPLTLPAIYDRHEGPAGFGDIVAIAGVKVCVEQARPRGGKWEDFATVDVAKVPCVMSEVETGSNGVVTGKKLEFPEVPGMSELILTASKDGYIPSVFAVTTGQFPNDTTGSVPGGANGQTGLGLRKRSAPWADLPTGLVPDIEGRGAIRVIVTLWEAQGAQLTAAWAAAGATITLEPAGEELGPFYGAGGLFASAAGRTPSSPHPQGAPYGDPVTSGATFVNVRAGEYSVHVEVPGASCRVSGVYGDTFRGFGAVHGGTLRAPVLAGHLTQSMAALCRCDQAGSVDLDAGVCRAGTADAGAPP